MSQPGQECAHQPDTFRGISIAPYFQLWVGIPGDHLGDGPTFFGQA